MGKIINFNVARKRLLKRQRASQHIAGAGNPLGLPNPHGTNQYTRRDVFRLFAAGAGLRKAGQMHPEGEAGFAADVRAALPPRPWEDAEPASVVPISGRKAVA